MPARKASNIGVWSDSTGEPPRRYHSFMQTSEGIVWETNLEAALERAKAGQRFVVLDVFNPG